MGRSQPLGDLDDLHLVLGHAHAIACAFAEQRASERRDVADRAIFWRSLVFADNAECLRASIVALNRHNAAKADDGAISRERYESYASLRRGDRSDEG